MNALALSLRAVLAPVAGVPFALAALLPLTVVDGQHAVLGLVTAVLATFTLVLPVMAIISVVPAASSSARSTFHVVVIISSTPELVEVSTISKLSSLLPSVSNDSMTSL